MTKAPMTVSLAVEVLRQAAATDLNLDDLNNALRYELGFTSYGATGEKLNRRARRWLQKYQICDLP